jgi:hypothetical protein
MLWPPASPSRRTSEYPFESDRADRRGGRFREAAPSIRAPTKLALDAIGGRSLETTGVLNNITSRSRART